MATYAKIGLNNKVILVVPFDDNKILDVNGIEQEEVGRQILENETGWPLWIKCSINTIANKHYTINNEGVSVLSADQSKAFRGNAPSINYIWDEENLIFWPPKPYPSYTKNLTTALWNAPVSYPNITTYIENNVEKKYNIFWNEELSRWETATKDTLNQKIKKWNSNTLVWEDI